MNKLNCVDYNKNYAWDDQTKALRPSKPGVKWPLCSIVMQNNVCFGSFAREMPTNSIHTLYHTNKSAIYASYATYNSASVQLELIIHFLTTTKFGHKKPPCFWNKRREKRLTWLASRLRLVPKFGWGLIKSNKFSLTCVSFDTKIVFLMFGHTSCFLSQH